MVQTQLHLYCLQNCETSLVPLSKPDKFSEESAGYFHKVDFQTQISGEVSKPDLQSPLQL